jgi:ligand-binding sensor domain-containing protein
LKEAALKRFRAPFVSLAFLSALFALPIHSVALTVTTHQAGTAGLTANYVTAVAVDDQGTAWIGTGGGGLVSLADNGQWAVALPANGFTAKEVSSIVIDRGAVLAGTEQGIFIRDKEGAWKATFEVADGKLQKPVMELLGGDLWAGALGPKGGLFHRKGDGSWEKIRGPESEEMNDVLALEAVGKALWIGTMNHGLYRYEQGSWKQFDMKTGLPHFYVADLAWDGESLWAALPKKGLVRIKDGAIESVTAENGLPLSGWFRLHYDTAAESLWVGTDKSGLARFDGRRWTTYGKEDGLVSLRIFAIGKATKGLWLGTDLGLVSLVP